jgi:hydrogenase expression/formation protein HypC
MCLAIPAKIISVNGAEAVVEIGGIRRSANVGMVQNPQPGEFVLLHAGFAIQKWTAEQAAEHAAIMSEMEGLGGVEEEST